MKFGWQRLPPLRWQGVVGGVEQTSVCVSCCAQRALLFCAQLAPAQLSARPPIPVHSPPPSFGSFFKHSCTLTQPVADCRVACLYNSWPAPPALPC